MNNPLAPIDLSDSANEVVSNLTSPTTKNAGQTFGDIWFLVFGGISHAANKKRLQYSADLEKYNRELSQSIDAIPSNKKVEPSIQITAQALDSSKYCISSELLRNMFVKLITGTMHSDLEPLVHPSFPEIIKQMDNIDAKILMELKRSGDAPIVMYKLKTVETKGSRTLFENAYISQIFHIPLEKCNSSLSLLERMGIVKLSYENYFVNDDLYEPFWNTDLYYAYSEELSSKQNLSIEITKGICSITPLGKRFIEACVS